MSNNKLSELRTTELKKVLKEISTLTNQAKRLSTNLFDGTEFDKIFVDIETNFSEIEKIIKLKDEQK